MRFIKKVGEGVVEFRGAFPGRSVLLAAGWIEYAGALPAERLEIGDDGTITEMPEPERELPSIHTKLAIRRACRALGLEERLDALLGASAQFRTEWSDALEIDLTDPMTLAALAREKFSAADIAAIVAKITEAENA